MRKVILRGDSGLSEIVLSGAPVNELSEDFVEQLEGAIDAIPPEARAIAIVSDVDRVFMAGGDIAFMREESMDRLERYVRRLQALFTRIERLPLPVVAGIDGACLGGGLELALSCDIRVASEPAMLGFPEVQLGIIAGAGGTQRLVRAIGQGAARDLLLTGRRITAAEALSVGLVSRVVPAGKATAAGQSIGEELASGAGEAIQASKRLAAGALDNSLDVGLERELAEWLEVRRSSNSTEGLSAFLERRSPRFS